MHKMRQTNVAVSTGLQNRIHGDPCLGSSCTSEKLIGNVMPIGIQKQRWQPLSGTSSVDISGTACLLQSCANTKDLTQGRQIHEYIMHVALEHHRFLGNLLVQMYGKCASIKEARNVFDRIDRRNSYTWNIMLVAYTKQGHLKDAHILFQEMPERDLFAWNTMIAGYARLGKLNEALQLFQVMPVPDTTTWNTMIGAYVRDGYLTEAYNLFERMPQRNHISWTIMIAANTQRGYMKEALQLFHEMPHQDVGSWNALIVGYTRQGMLNEACKLFEQMPERDITSWNVMLSAYIDKGHIKEAIHLFTNMPERDIISWNAMVGAHGRAGEPEKALQLFEEMPKKDSASWNTIISAYARKGDCKMALQLFQRMPEPNVISWTALISSYTQQGLLEEALEIFKNMPNRNVVSWNAIIDGYAQQGHLHEAVQLLNGMILEGIKPDKYSFSSILHACSERCALTEGKKWHTYILNYGLEADAVTWTAVVDMYAKCGSLEDAQIVFDTILEHDIFSWTAIIAAYSQYGYGEDVLKMSQHMQLAGTMLNGVTFCCILSACSHAGLVHNGGFSFMSMLGDYCICPIIEHYNCMIDLLGHAGWLDEAEALLNNIAFQPVATSYNALLVSCISYCEADRAVRLGKHISDLQSVDSGICCLLSNLYAATWSYGHSGKCFDLPQSRSDRSIFLAGTNG